MSLGPGCYKIVRNVINELNERASFGSYRSGNTFRVLHGVDVRLGWRGAARAILAGVAAATVACSSAPPKSPEQERADAATTKRVYTALDANPIYYFRDVDVSVDYGVAQLSGYVWTTDALYAAERITRGVPGVSSIRDTMELERQGNRGGGDGGGGQ
jgi:hyperosmotically inducible periplasmic protein